MYEFKHVRGHIEVFEDGKFVCSADTIGEARMEIENEEISERVDKK